MLISDASLQVTNDARYQIVIKRYGKNRVFKAKSLRFNTATASVQYPDARFSGHEKGAVYTDEEAVAFLVEKVTAHIKEEINKLQESLEMIQSPNIEKLIVDYGRG